MNAPTRRPALRTARTSVAACAASVLVAASQVPANAGVDRAPGPHPALQAAVDAALSSTPGGVQISDNAVAWDGGNVILVIPTPGQQAAPPGLGHGVREDALSTPVLQEQAALGAQSPAEAEAQATVAAAGVETCPGGWTVTDYYCFYEHRDYGGRRLQFTGNTSAEYASNYGFNNQTSSWVSNDVDCYLNAYDTRNGSRLWQQPEKSTSSWVGNANNDKMSYWTCN